MEKEAINQMKRHPTEQEKIYANHIFDNRLICKYINNSYNSRAKEKLSY